MGVQISSGSGVVNEIGISSSRPVHRLVGVAMLVGGSFVSVGGGSSPILFVQEEFINRIMKNTAMPIG